MVVVVCIEVLGDLVEVVLAFLRQLDIGIFVGGLSLLGDDFLASRCLFFYVLLLLFEPGRRLRILEVKLMAVVPGLDLVIERLGPILVIIDISRDAVDLLHELLVTIGLNV